MKKIFALILAIVMMASMSVVAFAAPAPDAVIVDDAAVVPGGTDLIYNVSQTYTVVIPASLAFTAENLDINDTVSVHTVKIAKNRTLEVFMASSEELVLSETVTIDKAAWTLVDTNQISDAVSYAAKYGSSQTPVAADVAILSVTMAEKSDETADTAGAAKDVAIYFSTEGTSQVGNYKDVLTFTTLVSVK